MRTLRTPKNGNPKQGQRKMLSKWKKKITAEASRRSRAMSDQTLPDTSAIPWL
jgi:hypothetical protein